MVLSETYFEAQWTVTANGNTVSKGTTRKTIKPNGIISIQTITEDIKSQQLKEESNEEKPQTTHGSSIKG